MKKLTLNVKGIKGDSPSREELVNIIRPLIPSPIPGKDGDTPTIDYDKINRETTTIVKREVVKIPRSKIKYSEIEDAPDINVKIQEVRNEFPTVVRMLTKDIAAKTYDIEDIKGLQAALDEASSVTAFIDLTDTFSSYAGLAGRGLRVNATATGIDTYIPTDTDERVKYDAADPAGGYISAKFVAGTGIALAEGAGADENKLVITNTGVITESDPVFAAWEAATSYLVLGDNISLLTNDAGYITSSALTPYAKLDGSNQPFTGDLTLTKASPSWTLKDTKNDSSWVTGYVIGSLNFNTSDTTGLGARTIGAIELVNDDDGSHPAAARPSMSFKVSNYNTAITEGMRLTYNHLLGIGTSAPARGIEFASTISTEVGLRLSNMNNFISAGQTAGIIEFYNADNSAGAGVQAYIQSIATNAGQNYSLEFGTGVANSGTNPTQTRMTINHTGSVGIGSAPLTLFSVEGGTASTNAPWFYQMGHTTNAGLHFFGRSGGTTIGSRTAIGVASTIGGVLWQGADGSAMQNVAYMAAITDGAVSSTSSAGHMVFSTTPSGTVSVVERMRINSNGTFDIGAGALTSNASHTIGFDISYGNIGLVVGADANAFTRTNSTNKESRMGMPHYTNAEEPAAVFLGSSTSTANNVFIGGGSSLMNAATQIGFFTAANNTTVTGTRRMTIDSAGNVGIGTLTPATWLNVLGITEQLRLSYDASNYMSATVNSTGSITLALTGTTPTFTFSQKIIHSAPTNLKNYTVATLPAGVRGDIAYVTDALPPAFLATVVGGGAVVTPVFYDGTNWVAY